ncbi:PP-loop family-domain-containing protein [Fomitopsis serialis]|uniref:PP-loop family-domain-containing protein n=1 Tax=Fomitopsis serialis TaxID=139415 RepID=UPI002008AECD|nr:PP-loop family-domain-containing protein [Neoantrodia serialis]KAH9928218.1 PP-loop family-domain-containing protein [Neoantrodia serialis]
MPSLAAISKGEFLQLFQRCMPPGGWPDTIAVANSGGPDSTCLLYNLSSLVKNGPSGLPQRLLSIHINHQLQAASNDMADLASRNARALDVEHLVFTVPWSKPPYPNFPHAASTESLARSARMRAFFDLMTREGATVLALGHHADDQVETVIMRAARQSRFMGLGGMMPVRRWGMGDDASEDPLASFGNQGMSRWMVRPFLTVPKARILSTCDQNALKYTIDKTNFEPSLTVRNAIRHALDSSDGLHSTLSDVEMNIPKLLKGSFDSPQNRDDLREIVRLSGQHVDMVNGQVDNILARCLLPTLPSTVTLPSAWLQNIPSDTLEGLMARVLRYVSCHPWGSRRARASGSSSAYQVIMNSVTQNGPEVRPRSPFVPGASVLFRPGFVAQDGIFRQVDQQPENMRPAWRLQRTPPHEKNRSELDKKPKPLLVKIAPLLSQWRPKREDPILLYDHRFRLHFDMARIPPRVLSVLRDNSDAEIHPGGLSTRCIGYVRGKIEGEGTQTKLDSYEASAIVRGHITIGWII